MKLKLLDNVLKRYETSFNRNPHVLRAYVPPYEIWRFFMEAHIQSSGRLKLKAQDWRPQDLRKTIQAINAEQPQVAKHPLCESGFWALPPASQEQLTLYELIQADQSWLPFEINEPGYFNALVNAFDLLFTPHTLTLDFIIKLHQTAIEGVRNTNYENSTDQTTFRKSYHGMTYLLNKTNSTRAGLKALLKSSDIFGFLLEKRDQDGDYKAYFSVPLWDIEAPLPYIYKDNESSAPIGKEISENITCKKRWINYLYRSMSRSSNVTVGCYTHLTAPTQDDIPERMQRFIDNFNKAITTAQATSEKLLVILEFIQRCEQTHPFLDANGRTFCMLLLNDLLIAHGFPFAILNNPNCFDGFSLPEIFDEVILGMHNTFKLIDRERLFRLHTPTYMNTLSAIPFFQGRCQYFDATIQLERKHREEQQEVETGRQVKRVKSV